MEPGRTAAKHCESITVRELLDAEIKHLKEQTQLNFELLKSATDRATSQLDERLARMNEFRDALKDQAARFVTRSELDALVLSLSKDVQLLREFASRTEGKASITSVYAAWGLAIVAILVTLIDMLVVKP